MSLSATLFGENSLIFKATNVLGLGIPGMLHRAFGPGEPEAMRLGDISRQTAKEGDPRTIVWGRARPIGGNIIHSQSPVKRMVKQSSSGGGKGGSKKKTQKVEHVFRTYAIGVCEGPITSFSRIWRNNKLVYDARGNEWGEKNNPVFLKTFRLYLGVWDQMPDPTLQSIWGVDNVPAYRGTAYMVSIDEDLTDQGGMVPQWLFEVERAEGVAITSKPYAAEQIEQLDSGPTVGAGVFRATLRDGYGTESFSASPSPLGGGLRAILFTLDVGDESLASSPLMLGGSFKLSLRPVDDGTFESTTAEPVLAGGGFRTGLVSYNNDNDGPEKVASSPVLLGGSHG